MSTLGKRATIEPDAAATRRRIVQAARELIREQGYEAVTIGMVLARSGVSRGGLYHHFAGKRELLAAVLEAVEVDFISSLGGAIAEAPDPRSAVLVGVQWYVDECVRSEELRRIGIVEGRAALGWELWRSTIQPYGVSTFAGVLEHIGEGRASSAHALMLAYMLVAALHEAAALILVSPDPVQERERARAVLDVVATGVLDQLEDPARGAMADGVAAPASPPRGSH